MRTWLALGVLLLAGCDASEPTPKRAPPPPTVADGPPPPAASAEPVTVVDRTPEPQLEPMPEPDTREPIGTFDDWVKGYMASSAPEGFRPPRLRRLADARGLPHATMWFERSGKLHSLSLPSGEESALFEGPSSEHDVRFTADGTHAFFLSNRGDAKSRLYRATADGHSLTQVTVALRGAPTWAVSRDGRRVAFAHGQEHDGVHVVDVDGGRSFTAALDGVEYLSFSRDGQSLFVVRGDMMARTLSRIDVATQVVTVVPTPPRVELSAPWDLGDGRMLLVSNEDFGMMNRAPYLSTVPTSGGAFRRVGRFSVPIGYLSFELSPDAKVIAAAWSQRQGGLGAAFHSDVALIDTTTGAITSMGVTHHFPRPFYQASAPSFSPDGHHIATTLRICARSSCEPLMRSVVLSSLDAQELVPIFVADGGEAVFRPEP